MAEEHIPKPLLQWLALGQYDPRGRVALAGGLIKGQQSGSDQPLSYGDPWLDGSQQLSLPGDLGHLTFYLSPSLNLPLYYDFETQGEKPMVWVFDLILIDSYRWMTPRGSGGLFIPAGCKTIDRFLKKQHRFFLFIPWHVNKKFEPWLDGDWVPR